jgi:nucleoside-diphosphate-sugar epimerase
MKFSIVLGDTGFLGSAFSRSLSKEDADFIGLNRQRVVLVLNRVRTEFQRKSTDLFTEIEPYLSEDCVVINTIWGSNNRDKRDSIVQQKSSVREISLINHLENSRIGYVSFGSIAEINNLEISPSCNTEYAEAKRLVAERLLKSKLIPLWIRVASSYGPDDRRNWLVTQLLNSWVKKEDLYLENPGQMINLCHVDSLVSASLELIKDKQQGIFNATTAQWLTVEAVKNCFNKLREPQYLQRTSGPFSPADLNQLPITSPPLSEYFATFQKNYKS